MIHIAIIAGGPSAERGVSLKSAQTVAKHLPSEKYNVTTIDITPEGWKDIDTGAIVDLNRFCLPASNGQPLKSFDFAFIIIHGTPAEDGKLQGYLDMMGIPHSACNVLTSALTFNKQVCKDHLKQYNIPMAESMIVTNITSSEEVQQHSITLPLFVKPNNNGSSYGVTKVKAWDQLETAIRHALEYDHEVMIERALAGKEFSVVLFEKDPHIMSFPLQRSFPRENSLILQQSMKDKVRRSLLQDLIRRSLRNVRKDPEGFTSFSAVAEWSGLIISLKVRPSIYSRPIQH